MCFLFRCIVAISSRSGSLTLSLALTWSLPLPYCLLRTDSLFCCGWCTLTVSHTHLLTCFCYTVTCYAVICYTATRYTRTCYTVMHRHLASNLSICLSLSLSLVLFPFLYFHSRSNSNMLFSEWLLHLWSLIETWCFLDVSLMCRWYTDLVDLSQVLKVQSPWSPKLVTKYSNSIFLSPVSLFSVLCRSLEHHLSLPLSLSLASARLSPLSLLCAVVRTLWLCLSGLQVLGVIASHYVVGALVW